MHTFHKIYVTNFSSRQRDLYEETFRDLVQSVLEGYNGTIFAYGQTRTGLSLYFELFFHLEFMIDILLYSSILLL